MPHPDLPTLWLACRGINGLSLAFELHIRIAVTLSAPIRTGRPIKAIMVIGLIVGLSVFSILPCLAGTLQVNAGCCRHHSGCHQAAQPQRCTMESPKFTPPNLATPPTATPVVARFTAQTAPAPSFACAEMTSRHGIATGCLYLRNSALLI